MVGGDADALADAEGGDAGCGVEVDDAVFLVGAGDERVAEGAAAGLPTGAAVSVVAGVASGSGAGGAASVCGAVGSGAGLLSAATASAACASSGASGALAPNWAA